MINILCNADRTWQMKHFGYGFQTHSWADLVAKPIKLDIRSFCQCRSFRFDRAFRVKGLKGLARECLVKNDGVSCLDCGRAAFFTSRFDEVAYEFQTKEEIKMRMSRK
jgi:hypothetical protein